MARAESRLLLSDVRLVTADGEFPNAWVMIAGDRIHAVGHGPAPAAGDALSVDGGGMLALPGLVDIHQHGGGGHSYADGAVAAAKAAGFHLRLGTTTSVASLMSAPLDLLLAQVDDLVPLVDAGVLAGIHLEGPWISRRRRGAHQAAALAVPGTRDVERLLGAGRGRVRVVTIAPELPGSLDAIRRLRAAGVAVAIGHTNATYEEVAEALRYGATLGTHLFNGMRPVHHRDPGPVVALLESEAAVELVADGVHLHPRVLAGTAACLGPDRAILVTDAMAATGMPDGRYVLGDREVTVVEGVARGSEGQLSGSTVTLAAALRHAVTVAGVPLAAAVAAATRVPARALGLRDVGELRPGALANLLLMTPDLEVSAVLRRGSWIRAPRNRRGG